MSISSSDLKFYGAASYPEADTGSVGGAIATATKVEFTQFTSSAVAEVLSDGADTRTGTVYGRLATGVMDSEAFTLNGTTPVTMAKTWERIQKVVLDSSSGTRTVSVKQGASGTVRITLEPNITKATMFFIDSTSESSTATRYEKGFAKNEHGSLSLLTALLTLTADPASRMKLGAAPSVGDSATAATRKTAPTSVSFVDDNVAISVPGTNLAAGSAIGFWLEQTLPSNDPANKTSFTCQISGSST